MGKEWKWLILLSMVIALLIPVTIVRWIDGEIDDDGSDFTIRVLMTDGKIETMKLESYLIGVVAGEMPAEFADEALKAQAVAARTYAAKKMKTANEQGLEYDVDTTVQTQVWISDSQMRKNWGWSGYRKYYSKIKAAVRETKGVVMVDDGDYIDAYFHSSSGRKATEKPEEVWSSARSYLKNVESGEVDQLRYVNQYKFTPRELCQKLSLAESYGQSIKTTDIQALSRTTAGRIKTMAIYGKSFQATQLRTLLGFSSTDIEWTINGQEIVFTAYGNGHAVGMSQYGANDMAKSGLGYEEILKHFYVGVSILTLS